MLRPTQDKALKLYLMKSIQSKFGYVDYKNETPDTKATLDKLTTKILRHLNELGYVQIPRPAISDGEPKQSNNKSDLTEFWDKNDEYFSGIMNKGEVK